MVHSSSRLWSHFFLACLRLWPEPSNALNSPSSFSLSAAAFFLALMNLMSPTCSRVVVEVNVVEMLEVEDGGGGGIVEAEKVKVLEDEDGGGGGGGE